MTLNNVKFNIKILLLKSQVYRNKYICRWILDFADIAVQFACCGVIDTNCSVCELVYYCYDLAKYIY